MYTNIVGREPLIKTHCPMCHREVEIDISNLPVADAYSDQNTRTLPCCNTGPFAVYLTLDRKYLVIEPEG